MTKPMTQISHRIEKPATRSDVHGQYKCDLCGEKFRRATDAPQVNGYCVTRQESTVFSRIQ